MAETKVANMIGAFGEAFEAGRVEVDITAEVAGETITEMRNVWIEKQEGIRG